MGVAVRAQSLRHSYRTAEGQLTVLDDVDLDVPEAGYAAVTGPSGAGKTTLLAVLGGLERPQAGRVEIGDVDLSGLTGDGLAAYRRTTVGFVFQHFGLLDTLSAAENVELACSLAGTPAATRRARAAALLGAVGLAARTDHRPGSLSGGERQRVALARAVANSPQLLLADEPTGNLDDDAARTVIELLEQTRERYGCTLVIVTHNAALAARASQRLALRAGRFVPA
jgi:predicted ABC-type transport system involved in lysophospholipase L1 biosynthesis ATPase subunit